MKNINFRIISVKFILSFIIIVYMSYNIYININYIIYYTNVINKNKHLYYTLANNISYKKEENCSEILEKISKEKNCILSKVTKDDNRNLLEVNISYTGKLEELKEFILKTSKEKSFNDIKYIHIHNNKHQVQSEIYITFKI